MSVSRHAAPPTELKPPWHYRLGKWLGRRGVRGSGMLIRLPYQLGRLRRVVRFPVLGDYTIDVPLYRRANQWDAQQIAQYEAAYLETLATLVQRIDRPVTLVDCGADIGLFSVALAARCANIAGVVAFEPDEEAHEILVRNLSRLSIDTECHPLGVGAICGRAQLVPCGNSEHAQYLVADAHGDVEVTTIDAVLASRPDIRHRGLVLKVDVEGGELAALQGAESLLRMAPAFLVGFEAHRATSSRVGIDPIECARFLNSLRPCQFVISELAEQKLLLNRPFFDQVRTRDIVNVIAFSNELSD